MSTAIVLAPACGPEVGGGHVMRSAALATALSAQGCACTFAVGPEGAAILERFFPGAFATANVRRGDGAALAALAAALVARAVVVDDYAADAELERRLAAPGRVLVAVDDLSDRPHAVDLLFDPGPERRVADYADLAPGAEVRVGPAYALLRPGFAAPASRPPAPVLRRLFVSFGLSDVGGVAARAVRLARRINPRLAFDVALSADAPSRRILEGEAGVALHIETPDVLALMLKADAALGAGGSGAWERAALGLPSLTVVVADNQRPAIDALFRADAVIACDLRAPDFEAAFTRGLADLASPEVRTRLSARSRALCDGRGAERAADAILAAVRTRS